MSNALHLVWLSNLCQVVYPVVCFSVVQSLCQLPRWRVYAQALPIPVIWSSIRLVDCAQCTNLLLISALCAAQYLMAA